MKRLYELYSTGAAMKIKAFLIISLLFTHVLIFGSKANCQTADVGDMIVDNHAPYVVKSIVYFNGREVSKLNWIKADPIMVPESNGYGVIRVPLAINGTYPSIAANYISIRVVFSEPLDANRKPIISLRHANLYTTAISMDAEDTANISYTATVPYALGLKEYIITIEKAYDSAGNKLDSIPATIAERNISDPKTWKRYDTDPSWSVYAPDNNHVFYVSQDKIANPAGFTETANINDCWAKEDKTNIEYFNTKVYVGWTTSVLTAAAKTAAIKLFEYLDYTNNAVDVLTGVPMLPTVFGAVEKVNREVFATSQFGQSSFGTELKIVVGAMETMDESY